ncbi:unnamed protein product [Orchesella dallaii]|uniref:Uncharacterized protein n=1 Tax=Orchesella dallaii TaxID=48710 RepID=A0ABP1RX69_9HEXA
MSRETCVDFYHRLTPLRQYCPTITKRPPHHQIERLYHRPLTTVPSVVNASLFLDGSKYLCLLWDISHVETEAFRIERNTNSTDSGWEQRDSCF